MVDVYKDKTTKTLPSPNESTVDETSCFISPNHELEDLEWTVTNTLRRRQLSQLWFYTPWLTSAILTLTIIYLAWRPPSTLTCTRMVNSYSPVIEANVLVYKPVDFENTFAHETIYRGPPTIELEQAWGELWGRGSMEIPQGTETMLNRSGTEDHLEHVDNKKDRGYTGVLEVFHQLHCLSLIRQYTWKGYYTGEMEKYAHHHHKSINIHVDEKQHIGDRIHVDHCIETLRLSLMCNADVTPLLTLRLTNGKDPTTNVADLNTHHVCRDWDAILEWQDKHTIGER